MAGYASISIAAFLEALSARTPTPGGGSSAALTGATGCAQARMVVAYSIGPKTDAAARPRLETAADELDRCDRMLRALMDEDAAAYERMTAAGKAARADESKREAHQAAIATAALVPLQMAAIAATALQKLDDVKAITNRYLASDAAVAAMLLDASARAAACSVRVNLKELEPGDARTRIGDGLASLLAHAAERCARIEAWVTAGA